MQTVVITRERLYATLRAALMFARKDGYIGFTTWKSAFTVEATDGHAAARLIPVALVVQGSDLFERICFDYADVRAIATLVKPSKATREEKVETSIGSHFALSRAHGLPSKWSRNYRRFPTLDLIIPGKSVQSSGGSVGSFDAALLGRASQAARTFAGKAHPKMSVWLPADRTDPALFELSYKAAGEALFVVSQMVRV